jgi:hypothetical protein
MLLHDYRRTERSEQELRRIPNSPHDKLSSAAYVLSRLNSSSVKSRPNHINYQIRAHAAIHDTTTAPPREKLQASGSGCLLLRRQNARALRIMQICILCPPRTQLMLTGEVGRFQQHNRPSEIWYWCVTIKVLNLISSL